MKHRAKFITLYSHSRFVQSLFNLTSVLKPYWKNLQMLNEDDKNVKLEDYLKNWDENYRKNIAFYSYEERFFQT